MATIIVKTETQWEMLSSATRAAILEFLTATGPSSVKEVANGIGVSPELVHHHVRLLVESGFVIKCEPRKLPRHIEQVFRSAASIWKLDTKNPKRYAEGIKRMAKAWSRANQRILSQSVADKTGTQLAKFERAKTIRAETGPLDSADVKAIRRHLDGIQEIFKNARRKNDGKGSMHTIYWSFLPIEQ